MLYLIDSINSKFLQEFITIELSLYWLALTYIYKSLISSQMGLE